MVSSKKLLPLLYDAVEKHERKMVRSSDVDTDIVVGVLQVVTLESYLLMICLDYLLWKSIDLIKKRVSH